jgi:hypothetical protein
MLSESATENVCSELDQFCCELDSEGAALAEAGWLGKGADCACAIPSARKAADPAKLTGRMSDFQP